MGQRVPDDHVPPCGATTKRRDWAAHRALVRAQNRARKAAEKLLIAAHQERFDELYAMCAAEEGVTPKPRKTEADLIEEELAGLRAQLRRMGIEPDG